MLNCNEFRFQTGADPDHLTWPQRIHGLFCQACADYVRTMQRLNHQLKKALEIRVPPPRD